MKNYDFHTLLEPMEFQNLARDIIQIRDGIFFESFADGKDGGIDGLYITETEKIVLQAKRYGEDFSRLKYILKSQELAKVRKINPTRYILCVSMDLSTERKEEVYKIFEGYIKNTSDIITKNDLNNFLGQSLYKEVERNYPKLWLGSIEILSDIVDNSKNKARIRETEFEIRKALKTAKMYVQTNVYKKAFEILDKENVVLISGEPGMGKTSMAHMLAVAFLKQSVHEGFVWVNSIEDVYENMKSNDEPQVFILDDFWGSILYSRRNSIEETRLEKLIKLFVNDPEIENKKLILTSREYILQQALHQNELLYNLVEQFKLQCILEEYSDVEKTEILFQHLKASKLNLKYAEVIYLNSDNIVSHYGYNPRVIDLYLSDDRKQEVNPYEYLDSLIHYLKYPEDFWKGIFEELSTEAKMLASIILISHKSIDLMDIKTAYSKYCSTNFDIKNFEKVISELETTIIETYLDHDEESIKISFQNPSFEDFLYVYIDKHVNQYVPRLLEVVSFYDQLLYILEHFSQDCANELNNLIEAKCINELYTLPMKIVDYGDREYFGLGHPDEENVSGRVFHLIRLSDICRHKKLYNFLEEYIHQFLQNMQDPDFYFNYYELVNFPGLLKKCVEKGINFYFSGDQIIKNYYLQIFHINHYRNLESFNKIFPEDYKEFRAEHQVYFKNNIKAIIIDSLEFFLDEYMDIELDMLIDAIPDILEEYGLNYTEEFRQEVYEITGIYRTPIDYKEKHSNNNKMLPSNDITPEEKNYKRVVNENQNYFFEIENYELEDHEIIDIVKRSSLDIARQKQLLEILEKEKPWYIYEYLYSEKPLKELIFLMEDKEYNYDVLQNNVDLFFAIIIDYITKGDKNLIKRFLDFCIEFFFQILENGKDSISEWNLKRSKIYKTFLKDDKQLQEIVFKYLLIKKDNWFVLQNKLLLTYCFSRFIMSQEGNLYNILLEKPYKMLHLKKIKFGSVEVYSDLATFLGVEYIEYELEILLYKLFEEIEPEEFNEKHLYPLFKSFMEKFQDMNNQERVLTLLREMELIINISPSSKTYGSQRSVPEALVVTEYLDIGTFIDINDIEDLDEKEINLLIEKATSYDKYNDEYTIDLYKETDISLLKRIGIYDRALYTLDEIEKVYMRFSNGDYTSLLKTKKSD